MGALHEGHLELARVARTQCASVAASVFVNPMQFGPGEDFERYPRDSEGDREKLRAAGVDYVFMPDREMMYPAGFSTVVDVGGISAAYEGAIRMTHFRGVCDHRCKSCCISLRPTCSIWVKKTHSKRRSSRKWSAT